MVMAYILLAVLFSAEVGFIIFDQIRKSSKALWSKRRLIVNAGQAVLFALMRNQAFRREIERTSRKRRQAG